MERKVKQRKVFFSSCSCFAPTLFGSLMFLIIVTVNKYNPITISETPLPSKHRQETEETLTLVVEHKPDLKITQLNKKRQQRIQKTCEKYRESNNSISVFDWPSRLIVLESPSVIYCSVPKASNTNWKRIIMTVLQPGKYPDPLNIKFNEAHGYYVKNKSFLSQQRRTVENTTKLFNSSYKFLFARHPMERVLSAYRNKMLGIGGYDPKYQRRVGLEILRKRGTFASDKQAMAHYDDRPPTFSEFVSYVLRQHKSSLSMDKHWTPIFDLCNVCCINYDFIGQYKNIAKEATYVLKKLNVNPNNTFPTKGETGYVTQKQNATSDLLMEYYSQLTPDLYSQLTDIFKKDFDLFGYSPPIVHH